MTHPAALVFAVSMAVWVVDVRFAPAPASPRAAALTCQSGPSVTPPAGADLELVVCAESPKK